MIESFKAVWVVEERELLGIFGFKDMMSRAIKKTRPLKLTAISTVMAPNPEAVLPDTTMVEAIQVMHDTEFLTLPVCEDDGTVVGLVDVMDLIYGSVGADGWRSLFGTAMDSERGLQRERKKKQELEDLIELRTKRTYGPNLDAAQNKLTRIRERNLSVNEMERALVRQSESLKMELEDTVSQADQSLRIRLSKFQSDYDEFLGKRLCCSKIVFMKL